MEREDRLEDEIAQRAAAFINLESNRKSLITVTRAVAAKDKHKVIVLISVLPKEQEDNVLFFLKRKRSLFRTYLRKESRLKMIPTLDFELDYGEKNRERLDELSDTY